MVVTSGTNNIKITTNNSEEHLSHILLVIYSNPALPYRRVTVNDGLKFFYAEPGYSEATTSFYNIKAGSGKLINAVFAGDFGGLKESIAFNGSFIACCSIWDQSSGPHFDLDTLSVTTIDGTNYVRVATGDDAVAWQLAVLIAPPQIANQPPVAYDIFETLDEDTSRDITLTANDLDEDILTFSVVSYPSNGTLSGMPPNLTYTPNPNYYGLDSFTFKANDGFADSNVATVGITIKPVNDAPVAGNDSYSTLEDLPLTISAPGVLSNDNDIDNASLTATMVSGPSNGLLILNSNGSFSYTPVTNYSGMDSFTYQANDGFTYSNVATVTIEVIRINHPPMADAGGPYIVDEGSLVAVTATGYDPDGDDLTYAWDLDGDNIFETLGQSVTYSAVQLDGPAVKAIRVQVSDTEGLSDEAEATVYIENAKPITGSITAPIDPMQVNSVVNTSVSFTDSGVLDTHTATWDWGDGITSIGPVTESNGSGTVIGSHAYTTPGVYTVKVSVIDDDDGWSNSIFQYVVAYDPTSGFVTGGGWINSPAGAYVQDPSLSGKATFGFVSKYKKGATVPEGVTEFHFQVADFNFHSNTYQWLVVAGTQAKFKGMGTINGQGSYKFMIYATDGQIKGGDGMDKFRIRIWTEDGNGDEIIIYDNEINADVNSYPTTVIGGGSITIHQVK